MLKVCVVMCCVLGCFCVWWLGWLCMVCWVWCDSVVLLVSVVVCNMVWLYFEFDVLFGIMLNFVLGWILCVLYDMLVVLCVI